MLGQPGEGDAMRGGQIQARLLANGLGNLPNDRRWKSSRSGCLEASPGRDCCPEYYFF